jgi:uncharacterized protein YcaQ
MGRARESLSADEARRLALAAQGFGRAREPGASPGWGIRRVIGDVGLLQIDSVNVLSRAHYLPAFSRLGPYPREALDRASHRAPRRLFEYWGHEASLLPVGLHPFLRWRMDRAADEAWMGVRRVNDEQPELVEAVLDEVRERGPLAASELSDEGPRTGGTWWDWSDGRLAIAWLFWTGQVTAARRRNFERLYDVPDRVLPAEVLAAPTPSVEDAQRELVRTAAGALGVAGERDLRDYFRLPLEATRARVAELVEAGELAPVEVEGWGRTQGYLRVGEPIPRRIDARALIGPFDSLVWERSRLERVFGFTFRLEIYVPQPKRVYGYYVLPFLLGDRLVARVDLKAHREASELEAKAVHLEDGAPPEAVDELRAELELMAGWLQLGTVRMPGKVYVSGE